MATASADINIVNRALTLLGVNTITALTDSDKAASTASVLWDDTRAAVFRAHPWNCLTKRVQLAEDSAAPVVEYANQFTLPTDCLRVLKVHNGTTDSIASSIDYAVEGRKIKTDEGTVFLVYIAKITDPNEYDTYLIEALAAAIAADIAYAITNNATLANNYQNVADERLREARFVDATENSLGTVESNEFTDARL